MHQWNYTYTYTYGNNIAFQKMHLRIIPDKISDRTNRKNNKNI